MLRHISAISVLFRDLLVSLVFATPVYADIGTQNIVAVDSLPCTPSAEICGSGYDENCDGVDSKCAGTDGDRDGVAATTDCDDSNKFIYPGVQISCQAPCGRGHKKCMPDGTYSDCLCQPLCEAVGAGRCYYVDPLLGTDSGSGTFESRWKTPVRLLSYLEGDVTRTPQVSLSPGDVVYFFSGVYSKGYSLKGPPSILPLVNIKGVQNAPILFKNYPGTHPVFSSTEGVAGLLLVSSEYVNFEGLVFDSTSYYGVRIDSSREIGFKYMIIRGTKLLALSSAGLVLEYSGPVRWGNSLIYKMDTSSLPPLFSSSNQQNITSYRSFLRVFNSSVF